MQPTAERLDVHLHPFLKARLIEESQKRGRPMNELVSEGLCLLFGLEVSEYPIPRSLPGRPAGQKNKKKRC